MIIVLVGSPFSGKTTLLKKLQENGMKVFSADSFINQIYKKDQEGFLLIKEKLGKEFISENSVDKRKLAIWATEEDNLKKLNELIHPLIKKYLEGKDGFIAELPIITNSPIKFNYDKVILVKANEETIKNRFLKSNFKNEQFINKIISDWNNDIKYDYVVDTTNNINDDDINNIIKLINEQK